MTNCTHIMQYIEPGRPLPCAYPECERGCRGEEWHALRLGQAWPMLLERTHYVRVWDDGALKWRQDAPWQ